MKLALVGTGRMGGAVARLAEAQGAHEVVARFDSTRPLLEETDPASLAGADVVIDFSLPGLALDHIHRYCIWGQDAVIGTTGWYGELSQVREWVKEGQIGLLYTPNFSLGVAVLLHALRTVAPLMDRLPEYDVFIHEMHHTGKQDSPSGTALLFAEVLIEGLSRKAFVEPEAQHGAIDEAALHVTSTRVGGVVGHHLVGFDSPFDRIELTHDAKNREGFAVGVLRSAEWIQGQQGLFTLDDVLQDWLS